MKVRFISDAVVKVENVAKTLFSTGDIQDLNDASADRWIRRGVAVLATGGPAAKKSGKKTGKK